VRPRSLICAVTTIGIRGWRSICFSTSIPPSRSIPASIFKTGGPVGRYDALTNNLSAFASAEQGGETQLTLQLSPYETALLVSGAAVNPLLAALPALAPAAASPATANELVVSGPWQIATATAKQYPGFTAWGTSEVLFDLTRPGTLPGFSGRFVTRPALKRPPRASRRSWIWGCV